jgi:hypothetical protein
MKKRETTKKSKIGSKNKTNKRQNGFRIAKHLELVYLSSKK